MLSSIICFESIWSLGKFNLSKLQPLINLVICSPKVLKTLFLDNSARCSWDDDSYLCSFEREYSRYLSALLQTDIRKQLALHKGHKQANLLGYQNFLWCQDLPKDLGTFSLMSTLPCCVEAPQSCWNSF